MIPKKKVIEIIDKVIPPDEKDATSMILNNLLKKEVEKVNGGKIND